MRENTALMKTLCKSMLIASISTLFFLSADAQASNLSQPTTQLEVHNLEDDTITYIDKSEISKSEKNYRKIEPNNGAGATLTRKKVSPMLQHLFKLAAKKEMESEQKELSHFKSATTFSEDDADWGIIGGSDDRRLVSDTGKYPYNAICKLVITYKDGSIYTSTGYAVANRLCATAGHCITKNDQNSDVKSVAAYYGYNNGSYTFKKSTPVSFILSTEYETDTEDYGFIVWNSSTVSKTGSLGMRSNAGLGEPSSTMGYPGDMYDAERMIQCDGAVIGITDTNLFINMDVKKGQSGSPVISALDGSYALGTVTHNSPNGSEYNFARKLDSGLIGWLINNGYTN